MKKLDLVNNELKKFYIFSIGQFVSQFGSKLTSYGLVLWAFTINGSVLSTSMLFVSYLIPAVFLSFVAGSVSDTMNKKNIILIADTIGALTSLSIILMLVTGTLKVEYLYVINIILGITDAFQNPASNVTMSLIVSKENYIKVSGIRSFFNSFLGIFAPVIATGFFAFCGLKLIVIVDLFTFVFAFITLILFVDIPKVPVSKKRNDIWSQAKLGIRFLTRQKDLLTLIIFMAFVNLIAGIYNTNLAPMILLRTNNNHLQLGIVTSTIGIAGLLGSILVIKVKPKVKRTVLIINIMSFSFLVCDGLLGIGQNYYIWTIAVFLGNLLIPFLTANVDYIMRDKTPIDMQGRVFAARNTLQYSTIPIANLLGGFLSDKIFEPFMKEASIIQHIIGKLVGYGKGSGIALLYICIGIIGFIGCRIFSLSKNMKALDEQ